MSKNIIIQEGGVGKSMSVNKLRTNEVGGGSCLWVPEDETTLKAKNISKNGTYAASSDNAYGYSQVAVSIPGGDGSATSSGKPTTSNGVDPGGIGSSVIGKDTSGVISGTPGGDGNEYAIGIDSGGNIVATKVPSDIEIGKTPDKTSYTEGETIDYSGIIVILKGGDSAVLSNQDYPNGRVPFNELIFPIATAPAPSGESGRSSELIPGVVIPAYTSATAYKGENYSKVELSGGAIGVVTGFRGGSFVGIVASPTLDALETRITNGSQDAQMSLHDLNCVSFIHDGKTVYYTGWINPYYSRPDRVEPTPTPLNYSSNLIAWTLVHGESTGGTAQIPVQWKSPYDGRTFEDTFEITVTGGSGGGYSDDSGGSESGGGGHF